MCDNAILIQIQSAEPGQAEANRLPLAYPPLSQSYFSSSGQIKYLNNSIKHKTQLVGTLRHQFGSGIPNEMPWYMAK